MSGTVTERPGTTAAPDGDTRGSVARWAADLLMGARFAVTSGREGWARTLLTAVGVGLGVALLLGAASVPELMASRNARGDARSNLGFGKEVRPGPESVLIGQADTDFHGSRVSGLVVRADGDKAPVPPGLEELPGPGEMVASPALAGLLGSPDAKLLRERLDYEIVGTIGDEGLLGPAELAYYAGGEEADFDRSHGYRIDHWGNDVEPEPLAPELLLLVIIGCVVLLMPVAIFVATAVRFGGERRDRRLAALRLVGADSRTTRRIAAGEAMSGSLLGLLVGAGLFLVARQFLDDVTLWDISVFTADVRPSAALAVLIALAVPASAVVVTLLALRGIAIEPLGVVRNAVPRRRKLWWRLVLPVLGLALLLPLAGAYANGDAVGGDRQTYQVAVGAVLVLVGITAVLPWLVEAAVNRLGAGPVPWQLAARRLQLSSGTAARAVSGITVAVAGAVAIQMLFAGAEAGYTKSTGQDPSRAQMQVSISVGDGAEAQEVIERFRATEGVTGVIGITEDYADNVRDDSEEASVASVTSGDCATLRELVEIGPRCEDGDVFVTNAAEYEFTAPGRELDLNLGDTGERADGPDLWTIPESARVVSTRRDPLGTERTGVFVTPSALDMSRLQSPEAVVMVKLDPADPEAAEHVRNTAADISPLARPWTLQSSEESSRFQTVRRGLFIGATATLLLIGASMVVSTLEQLRERRRLLSVLVAFGTRRATLAWSVLWQTAVPVVLGLGLAAVGGLGLGAVLMKLAGTPVAVDWAGLGVMTGIGGGVILLVTAGSMPPLWRMMRPEGLRTE